MKRGLGIAVFSLAFACSKGPASQPQPAAADTASGGTVIARLDGNPITDEDIRKVAGGQLLQAEMELYSARKEGLDQIIQDKLLEQEAGRQGIGRGDLYRKEVSDKVKVTDKDLQNFYQQNKDRMGGKSFDEMKERIRGAVMSQKSQDQLAQLVNKLKKKASVEVLISAPKVEVVEGDAPGIGPKNAPIRVVEFTDYQCPFCGKARDAVNQILKEYKGKVRYVIKDFPLSFHKDAFKAHEAAHCAGDQDKYWEMNKKLFGNQREIQEADLKKYAGEIKLEMKKFEECLSSGKYASLVQKSLQEGQSVGVSGTPAFFINGRMISGARPFESFKEIIDDELSTN